MKLLVLFFTLAFTSLTFAQNKSNSIDPKFEWFDSKDNLFREYREEISKIHSVLAKDTTDKVKYELANFSCHNFSKKLYLQNSSLITDFSPYNISDLESDWDTRIDINEDEKLELYYVTISSKEDGFYHAINAVLLNHDQPEKLSSYVFIEPQTDQIYLAYDLRKFSERMMSKSFVGQIKVEVRSFDAFKFNGNIWQSFSTVKHSGVILK